MIEAKADLRSGLSPRVRGNRQAGKRRNADIRVYPRVCGEP